MQDKSSATLTANPLIEDTLTHGLVLPPKGYCFHCGDLVPSPPFYSEVLGEQREMCCLGCQLASQSIVEAGLEQYYLDRSEINRTASLPAELTRLQAYDHDDIKSQFVYHDEGQSVAELSVNNLRCAACTWLIESRLNELEGVSGCQVNLTNQRMRVIWDETQLPISEILATINQIGYEAKPYRQDSHEAMLARHNKTMLLRLGIAALGAMQSMMFAVAIYFGEYGEMLLSQRDFLRWVSLFVSIPVFFYAGIPFFTSAWSAIKIRQVNMDVPVSIALIVTFFASLYATLTGYGHTYYDSVSMFIFFLLAGRYIEHNARLKAAAMANDLIVLEPVLVQRVAHDEQAAEQVLTVLASNTQWKANSPEPLPNSPEPLSNSTEPTSNLAALNPSAIDASNQAMMVVNELPAPIKQVTSSVAIKLYQSLFDSASGADGDNRQHIGRAKRKITDEITDKTADEMITAQSLRVGDIVMIAAGSEIISDGILLSPNATVSQSLLTGEGDLIVKQQGDYIVGGSQNDSQPFYMLVTALAKDSQIGLIDRLMNRAMSEKPKIAQKADELARWFVARILVLSVLVFIGWYIVDPSQAIWATVAVLVATCPCALSLATPIALTVATNRLASYGFLTTRGHTLQTLAEITHVAFDKTGTLTYGQPNLLQIEKVGVDFSGATDHNHSADVPLEIATDFADISSFESDIAVNSLTAAAQLASYSADELLAIAAALEVGSRHPVAHALLTAAYQMHLPVTQERISYPAGGVQAVVTLYSANSLESTGSSIESDNLEEAHRLVFRIGHYEFATGKEAEDGAEQTIPSSIEPLNSLQGKKGPDLIAHRASSAVVLSVQVSDKASSLNESQWQPLAYFYFNDSVRQDAKALIDQLTDKQLIPVMLTGDPSPQALVLAEQLGIEQAYNGLSPEDKVHHIQKLQAQGARVLMVGDGINDAPVLAAADVSSSIAGAADLAQVSSDSIILNGQIGAIADAKRIADKTNRIIKQNFNWALIYNGLVLIPAILGYVPPWLAAIGMSLSSLLVVLNALRLKLA
ncbi:MAG: heavy metal translocating P-type ATPase [Psychrobacter sp.]|nr:heavy metal translocating P-type ATPase [Psychrobacter sp.]